MSTNLIKRKQRFFIAFLIITSLMIISLYKGLTDLTGTKERFTKAEEEVASLEEEKNRLEAEILGANQDIAKEKLIRDKLGLAKPGEIVVILPEDIGETNLESLEQNQDINTPNWKKWVDLFL